MADQFKDQVVLITGVRTRPGQTLVLDGGMTAQ
jgi:hypothetical protein